MVVLGGRDHLLNAVVLLRDIGNWRGCTSENLIVFIFFQNFFHDGNFLALAVFETVR
jgi:hypothetical protein